MVDSELYALRTHDLIESAVSKIDSLLHKLNKLYLDHVLTPLDLNEEDLSREARRSPQNAAEDHDQDSKTDSDLESVASTSTSTEAGPDLSYVDSESQSS